MKASITSPPSNLKPRPGAWLVAAGLAGALALALPCTMQAQQTSAPPRQQDSSQTSARADSSGSDSTKWGYHVDRDSSRQNPPGYRGMETPAGIDSSMADSSAGASATSRVSQRERQDSMSRPGQNPPGYRGMERPAGLNKAHKTKTKTKTKGVSHTHRDSTSVEGTAKESTSDSLAAGSDSSRAGGDTAQVKP
jgi:hypothetical protein